jgi:chemotaxis protein CheY-P-specific phosphatase CheC
LQALREVVNIAMGQAGSRLSELLGTFIQLPVPDVFITPYDHITQHLPYANESPMSAVSGNGVAGEAIALMCSDGFPDLESLVALDMDCHLLLLMTEDSIPALRTRVEILLHDSTDDPTC